MQIITQDYINERSIELYNEIDKIKDEEAKSVLTEWARNRIQTLREASTILDDDEFIVDALNVLDEYETDDEEFATKVNKFRNIFILKS